MKMIFVKSSVVISLFLIASAGSAQADFVFGTPTNLKGAVNSSSHEFGPSISADGLSLYFVSTRAGGQGERDLWVSTRPTINDDWGQPMNLGAAINSPYRDDGVCISADGLELYFHSARPGGHGGEDIWVARRVTINDEWGVPVNVGAPVNGLANEYTPGLSADGLSLYFASDRSGGVGGGDIWGSTRPSRSGSWGEPMNLGKGVNSADDEASPSISHEGLALFFTSWRPDVPGMKDMYLSTRATPEDNWGAALNLGTPINTTTEELGASISSDGLTLYYASLRGGGRGGADIWEVPIIRIVDFNGDGRVDIQDLLRMIKSWGTDDASVDIGPGPWGDGKIDAADLEVLMSYWGRDVDDPTLRGHWPFDETDGIVAHDLVSGNNGMVVGSAQWRPQGGSIGGALELNGTTFITGKSALSPADGPFSALVWAKGGAPGQAIMSDHGGTNWLYADPATGALATDLKPGGRGVTAPLVANVAMTDGQWHRVGLVWDGASRILYVDDKEVARGALSTPPAASQGLVIGAGGTFAPGTFWSGLIDDVRIYNRAVKP